LFAGDLPSRFRDSAKARVTPQQQIARMKGFYLKVRAVTRDEKPVANLITEELDSTDGREFAAELCICGIGALRKDKPNAIVPRRFLMIAEHTYYAVAQVDGKTGKHPTHLGIQWRERFQNKRVRGLLFWFGGMAHDLFTQTITGSPIIRLGLCQIVKALTEIRRNSAF
jgi:hypothetical protein